MAMYFKVDSKDRLWFLYTSSLRLQDEFHNTASFEAVQPAWAEDHPDCLATPCEVAQY